MHTVSIGLVPYFTPFSLLTKYIAKRKIIYLTTFQQLQEILFGMPQHFMSFLFLLLLKSCGIHNIRCPLDHLTNIYKHCITSVTASVCLCFDPAKAAWLMEIWIVTCCHKLSRECFKPIRFTKSCQKVSKKPKVDFTTFWHYDSGAQHAGTTSFKGPELVAQLHFCKKKMKQEETKRKKSNKSKQN